MAFPFTAARAILRRAARSESCGCRGRLSAIRPRCAASELTVENWKRSTSAISRPSASCSLACASATVRECAPRSKKFSFMPTAGMPSASCQTRATMRSISLAGLLGGLGVACAMAGGGSLSSALRSILPLSVSGMAQERQRPMEPCSRAVDAASVARRAAAVGSPCSSATR